MGMYRRRFLEWTLKGGAVAAGVLGPFTSIGIALATRHQDSFEDNTTSETSRLFKYIGVLECKRIIPF